jgi:hypothetical protein
MKTLLTGVAFALAIFFTSQAFAMPYVDQRAVLLEMLIEHDA